MMFYIGVCLAIWLFVGLTVGLKFMFFDKKFSSEYMEKFRKDEQIEECDAEFNLLTKNRCTFLAVCTIGGLIPLIADIYGSIKYRNH